MKQNNKKYQERLSGYVWNGYSYVPENMLVRFFRFIIGKSGEIKDQTVREILEDE